MADEAFQAVIVVDAHGIASAMLGTCRLTTAFQPIFALDERQVAPVAYEALLRCDVRQRSVPLAKVFAGRDETGRSLVEALSRRLHLLNAATVVPEPASLFVNLNPSLLGSEQAVGAKVAELASHLDQLRIHPARIVVEITEQQSCSGRSLEALVAGLRKLGTGLAIDDFGAECSDIRRVAQLKPDVVKLDRAWLWRLMDARQGRALVAHIVQTFADLGIVTVFEGIEHAWQLDQAGECGAELVQGFHLGRPVAAGEHVLSTGLGPRSLPGNDLAAAAG